MLVPRSQTEEKVFVPPWANQEKLFLNKEGIGDVEIYCDNCKFWGLVICDVVEGILSGCCPYCTTVFEVECHRQGAE